MFVFVNFRKISFVISRNGIYELKLNILLTYLSSSLLLLKRLEMKIQKLENRKKFDDEKRNNIFEFFCITQHNQVIR
jgi:hypothetical protein